MMKLALIMLAFAAATAGARAADAPAAAEGDTALRPCPARPNCVSTETTDPRHRMEPIPFEGGAEAAQARLEAVLRSMPRTTIAIERPGYLAVEFRSQAFGFVDEAQFLFDGKSRTIRFRSGARTGYSDFSVNRGRMEQVAEAFRAAK